jgi:hypothetical protein
MRSAQSERLGQGTEDKEHAVPAHCEVVDRKSSIGSTDCDDADRMSAPNSDTKLLIVWPYALARRLCWLTAICEKLPNHQLAGSFIRSDRSRSQKERHKSYYRDRRFVSYDLTSTADYRRRRVRGIPPADHIIPP